MSDAAAPQGAEPVVGVDSGTLFEALQSIPLEDETPNEAAATDAAPPQVEEVIPTEPVVAEAQPEAEVEASEPADPFESYLSELEADPPDEDALEDAEALKELGENPNSRARKRIQKLASRTKEAEAKASQFEAQLGKLQETVQQQARILRQQLAQAQQPQQPQVPQAQQAPQPGVEDNPFDQLMGHLAPRFEQELNQRIAPLQQKLEAYERQAQEAQQQAQYAAQVQQIEQQAASVRHMLIPGLPEEAYADPALSSALDEILITKAVAE